MITEISSFHAATHLEPLAAVLLRMREHDPSYPPPVDAESNLPSLRAWVSEEDTLRRWVALRGDQVAGHISLVAPHDYLTRFLGAQSITSWARGGFCEVSKFFVDPAQRSAGIGSQLFSVAWQFARSANFQLALAVVETSTSALRFYDRVGLREIGTFDGIHGVNHVFVDPLASPGAGKVGRSTT